MLTKGPVGFVAILLPIGINLMYKKRWKQILSLKWLLVVFIIAILLLPMSYGLYTQFDLQPEKSQIMLKVKKDFIFIIGYKVLEE
ncbi:MAG: hypothetical protein HC854_07140 [Flavobacterium sp.]|nr:hypothetical protein [Flavobacterium sp.]